MDDGRNILSDDRAKALQEIIEEWETGRVYVIPARGNCKTAAMKAALERAAEQAQQIKQHLTETRLERLAKEIDRQLERLLTEYPDTPVEDFVSSFIPGGVRITAPDGAAFDFRVHDAWAGHGGRNDDHDNGSDRHGDQDRRRAGMNNSRDCWSCAKRATECPGMTGPRDIEPACWVPEQEDEVTESAAGKHIECDPRRGWRWAEDLTPSTEELLEGVRLHETPAREMMNPPELTFEIADDGGTIYKRIAEVFDRSAAAELVRSEIELAKKRAPIIAVDFDGTLCENEWPGIGATKWETVQALIAARAAGARLILWTNRVGARLREAVEWCRNRELEFDAINENLPEILAAFTTDCRKVYADIYLDDKAAQPSAAVLEQLWQTARATMNEAAQKAGEGEPG